MSEISCTISIEYGREIVYNIITAREQQAAGNKASKAVNSLGNCSLQKNYNNKEVHHVSERTYQQNRRTESP